MRCPNCHRDNEPASRFCTFCGASLSPPQMGSSAEPAQIPADASPQQLKELKEEILRLSESIGLLNKRLVALEQRQGVTAPPVQVTPAPVEVVPPTPKIVPSIAEEAPPITQPPPHPPRPEEPARVGEWEQILGGNWLARVGVIALVIGAAFLVKFAVDNKWITPTSWVILGILAGMAMIGGGYYWQKKYPAFAQALSGGGIALLYLTTFAAFAIFRLLPLYASTVCLFLVSAGSTVLAIRYNSMALAIIGIFGAFSAPFILGGVARQAVAAQSGQGIPLLVYILVVDLGVLALSTFRNWRWFTLLALFGSLSAYGIWHGQFGNKASLLTSEVSLTIMFLIFVGATTLHHITRRWSTKETDYALMVINAIAYFSISYGLMNKDLQGWMGGFTLLLALFYGGLAYVAFRRGTENIRGAFFALGIAIAFLTLAIPIQLGDRSWVTITWAVEGVILMWLSFVLHMPNLRNYGYGVFVIMTGRLLFFDTRVAIRTFQPVLNERFLAFLFGIAACYVTGFLLRRERDTMANWRILATVFFVAANFFSVWLLSFEIWNHFGSLLASLQAGRYRGPSLVNLRNAQNLSLTALWAVYAVALLAIGIAKRWRLVRLGGLALLVIPIIKVFAYDIWTLELVYRIIACVGLGLLLLCSAYLYQRYGKAIRGFLVKD